MVAHSELTVDHLGNPRAGPQISVVASHSGSLYQDLRATSATHDRRGAGVQPGGVPAFEKRRPGGLGQLGARAHPRGRERQGIPAHGPGRARQHGADREAAGRGGHPAGRQHRLERGGQGLQPLEHRARRGDRRRAEGRGAPPERDGPGIPGAGTDLPGIQVRESGVYSNMDLARVGELLAKNGALDATTATCSGPDDRRGPRQTTAAPPPDTPAAGSLCTAPSRRERASGASARPRRHRNMRGLSRPGRG